MIYFLVFGLTTIKTIELTKKCWICSNPTLMILYWTFWLTFLEESMSPTHQINKGFSNRAMINLNNKYKHFS